MSLVGKRVWYKYTRQEGTIVKEERNNIVLVSPYGYMYVSELIFLDDEADEPVVVDGRLQEW